MARLEYFNAEDYEPLGDFDLIEPGEYSAIITESEWRETRSGDGRYLAFTFEIVDEEGNKYNGRKVWENLNLENPNRDAVNIASRRLSAICRAVGVLTPRDTTELHNRLMVIKVGIKKSTDNYPDKNYIISFKPYKEEQTAKAQGNQRVIKKPWE